ncbi:DUF418 domain-containing protein [Corynebacterium hindlerae]|uniref:DUF418 domain-containing protein n=1 Tax=Corynebacterium hindlerae TaxID=699041 RepID=UPI003AB07594
MTAPAPRTGRMLAPDFARGLTLLGIAGANITTTWANVSDAPLGKLMGGVVDDSVWDKIAIMVGAVLFHVRGLPMFATMLGFGVGLISLSLYRRGYPLSEARKKLMKRYGYLALFGLVHCVFMFHGDIMLTYGVLAIILALCLTLKDKTLLIIAAVLFALNALAMTGLGILAVVFGNSEIMGQAMSGNSGIGASFGSFDTGSYLGQLIVGGITAVALPFSLPMAIPMIGPLMIVGFVAARRGVLWDVDKHRRMLVWWAVISVIVMLGMGVPLGLSGIGVLPTSWEPGLFLINSGVGVLTGPGIVAMIALAVQRLQRAVSNGGQVPEPLVAIQALGKRSMSGYVFQSVAFMIFVMPYGLGLGQGLGAAETTGIAVVVWLVSVVGAYGLERAGKRGPLEALHRRLSYGPSGSLGTYQQPAGAQS